MLKAEMEGALAQAILERDAALQELAGLRERLPALATAVSEAQQINDALVADLAQVRAMLMDLHSTPPAQFIKDGFTRLFQWHGIESPEATAGAVLAHLATVEFPSADVSRALQAFRG